MLCSENALAICVPLLPYGPAESLSPTDIRRTAWSTCSSRLTQRRGRAYTSSLVREEMQRKAGALLLGTSYSEATSTINRMANPTRD